MAVKNINYWLNVSECLRGTKVQVDEVLACLTRVQVSEAVAWLRGTRVWSLKLVM